MISFDDCKELVRDLSIKTGKPPLIYGKKPDTQEKLDYAIKVIHKDISTHDHRDIEAAFKDPSLQDEITAPHSGFNCSLVRKYIKIHKSKRTKEEEVEERYNFEKGDRVIPGDCIKKLKKLGINVGGMVKDMPATPSGQPTESDRERKKVLDEQAETLRQ